MTARYPLVLNGTSIQEIQSVDTINLALGASLPLTSGVTGTLPIANGGTNATTAATALTNLGGASTGKAIAMSLIFGF